MQLPQTHCIQQNSNMEAVYLAIRALRKGVGHTSVFVACRVNVPVMRHLTSDALHTVN